MMKNFISCGLKSSKYGSYATQHLNSLTAATVLQYVITRILRFCSINRWFYTFYKYMGYKNILLLVPSLYLQSKGIVAFVTPHKKIFKHQSKMPHNQQHTDIASE